MTDDQLSESEIRADERAKALAPIKALADEWEQADTALYGIFAASLCAAIAQTEDPS